MGSTFSPLGFMIFGISISFYALFVQSQVQNKNNGAESASPAFRVSSSPPPPPPPPPPPLPPPPPPSPSNPETPGSVLPPGSSPYLHFRRSPPHPHPHRHRLHIPPPPPPHKMNAGKMVGLLFVGIAAMMQVGVVVFLVIKRRQLLKSDDRYETCS